MRPKLSKSTRAFDIVPFIPSRSPARWVADALLIACTAFAGASAAIFALLNQIGALQ